MTKPTILVADDMPLNFMVIEDLLEQVGCQAVCVSNGRQAVEKFLVNDYRLILLDLRMPVMDGLNATRLIRRHEHMRNLHDDAPRKHTPIVMLSASLHDCSRARNAGCDDYLLKPLNRETLWNALATYIDEVNERPIFSHPVPDIPPAVAHYPSPGIR